MSLNPNIEESETGKSEFKASLSYIANAKPAWSIQGDCVSIKRQKERNKGKERERGREVKE